MRVNTQRYATHEERNLNEEQEYEKNVYGAVPYMDAAYKKKLTPYVKKYLEYILSLDEQNPYGVPVTLGNWAGSGAVTGNVAPGLLFRHPDHFENYDDWPFLWGQNEGTIAGNTQYIIFSTALRGLLK